MQVAVKRITGVFSNITDAHRILREIYILRNLRHQNVIRLMDIPLPPSYDDFQDLYLVRRAAHTAALPRVGACPRLTRDPAMCRPQVFEFVDTDLYKLILSEQFLTTEHIQTFLYQLLCGLKYMHSAHVIHRDMKPANILLNEDCSLRICDFGLSRILSMPAPSPHQGTVRARSSEAHSSKYVHGQRLRGQERMGLTRRGLPTCVSRRRASLQRTRSLSVGVGGLRPQRMFSAPSAARRDRVESVDERRKQVPQPHVRPTLPAVSRGWCTTYGVGGDRITAAVWTLWWLTSRRLSDPSPSTSSRDGTGLRSSSCCRCAHATRPHHACEWCVSPRVRRAVLAGVRLPGGPVVCRLHFRGAAVHARGERG